MKTSLDLLEEVMEIGYGREYALQQIDAALDEKFRKGKDEIALSEELLPDELYNNILDGFKESAEFGINSWEKI